MQKITFLLLLVVAGTTITAQESSDEIWSNGKSTNTQANIFQQTDDLATATRTKEKPKLYEDTNTLTAPIDGGIGALLVVGALYGRRRWQHLQKTKA